MKDFSRAAGGGDDEDAGLLFSPAEGGAFAGASREEERGKAAREADRLRGLLRFRPEPGEAPGGRYVARCAPRHFVLPLLAGHFSRRFGALSWAIIDENRRVVLAADRGGPPRLTPLGDFRGGRARDRGAREARAFPGEAPEAGELAGKVREAAPGYGAPGASPPGGSRDAPGGGGDPWEDLWVTYHQAVTIEGRRNPALQRHFIPERFWRYLPEAR